MQGEDKIEIEVLPDGRVKIITDEVSATNHKTADELLAFFKSLMGGDVIIEKRKATHTHKHEGTTIKHSH